MATKKMGAPLRFPQPTGDPARDRIISLRRRLGVSHAALADMIGVTRQSVQGWENGTRSPSGPVLKLLEMMERKAK